MTDSLLNSTHVPFFFQARTNTHENKTKLYVPFIIFFDVEKEKSLLSIIAEGKLNVEKKKKKDLIRLYY